MVNKRHFGRVSRQLSAIVENEDGLRLKVVTVDASVSGVSFLCNIYQRDVMTPGGSFLRNGRPVRLSITLELPDGEGNVALVRAYCHIAYSRRISREKCMIGMRYIDFEQNSHERLCRFISQCMALSDSEQSAVCA
ncbi:MAG: PilZ domain-containing protein [Gammaproteobacteria bacterium]